MVAVNKAHIELENIAEPSVTGNPYPDKSPLTTPGIFMNPLIGRFMTWMSNRGWKAMASKNGDIVDASRTSNH